MASTVGASTVRRLRNHPSLPTCDVHDSRTSRHSQTLARARAQGELSRRALREGGGAPRVCFASPDSSPVPSRSRSTCDACSGFKLKENGSPCEGWFTGDIRRLADHPRFLAVPGDDAHGSQLVHKVQKNLPDDVGTEEAALSLLETLKGVGLQLSLVLVSTHATGDALLGDPEWMANTTILCTYNTPAIDALVERCGGYAARLRVEWRVADPAGHVLSVLNAGPTQPGWWGQELLVIVAIHTTVEWGDDVETEGVLKRWCRDDKDVLERHGGAGKKAIRRLLGSIPGKRSSDGVLEALRRRIQAFSTLRDTQLEGFFTPRIFINAAAVVDAETFESAVAEMAGSGVSAGGNRRRKASEGQYDTANIETVVKAFKRFALGGSTLADCFAGAQHSRRAGETDKEKADAPGTKRKRADKTAAAAAAAAKELATGPSAAAPPAQLAAGRAGRGAAAPPDSFDGAAAFGAHRGMRGASPPQTATRVASRQPRTASPGQELLTLGTDINAADEDSDDFRAFISKLLGNTDLDGRGEVPPRSDALQIHEAATESPRGQSPDQALLSSMADMVVPHLMHPRFARMRELAARVNVPHPNEQDELACATAWYNSEAHRHLQLVAQAPAPEIKFPLLVLWFAMYGQDFCHVPDSVVLTARRLCMAYGESMTPEEEEEEQEFNQRNCVLIEFCKEYFEVASLGGERLITQMEQHLLLKQGVLLTPPPAWSSRLNAIARRALMNEGFMAQAVGAAGLAKDAERMSARLGQGTQERWSEFWPRFKRVLSNTDPVRAHDVLVSAWWCTAQKLEIEEPGTLQRLFGETYEEASARGQEEDDDGED